MRRRSILLVTAVLAAAAVLLAADTLGVLYDGLLVRLSASGGLRGTTTTVAVWDSGRTVITGEVTARTRLTPWQRRDLRAALAATDFARLPARAPARCCDRLVYVVQYRRWTVSTAEPGDDPGLRRVVDLLGGVVSAHR
ncbi:hypothetical protein Daura_39165 [Dactylosporangium aurantiacum]|uniref:Uncharacterized protein n=1 Tax=Dactylosporangium aurantiacum TaxID=35754 RepID=A0A9Q9IAU6_9ACTN|nr:hypothetical protein [Dactylosporangium aurantiacum]MDG6101556.1 hypothetical protein [Dactylosporangium aurantiacum]UWZ52607.1 hypothetical protein Daura_39165 [Dactylosporangium aurantiacum]